MWQLNNEPEVVSSCSKVPKVHKLYISENAMIKIKLLMDHYTPQRLEWLAYFVGDHKFISDIYVPEQEVSTAAVGMVNSPSHFFIPGCIHSHHTMSNRFSGIDDKGINENNDISICINAGDGMQGHIRYTTDCGAYIYVPLQIIPEVEFDDIAEITVNTHPEFYSFLQNAIQNIHQFIPKSNKKTKVGEYKYIDTEANENDMSFEDELEEMQSEFMTLTTDEIDKWLDEIERKKGVINPSPSKYNN